MVLDVGPNLNNSLICLIFLTVAVILQNVPHGPFLQVLTPLCRFLSHTGDVISLPRPGNNVVASLPSLALEEASF